MKKSVVFLLFLGNLASCAESYNIDTYRVFGPEHPGQYKHPASITQLANGDLYISYYGGSAEYGDDTAVYGSRLKVGETKWTEPKGIANTPDRGEGNSVVWQAPDYTPDRGGGNSVVWQAPDGRGGGFYGKRYGASWAHA
nr:hypothetical protein [Planctomycetota bacterium]